MRPNSRKGPHCKGDDFTLLQQNVLKENIGHGNRNKLVEYLSYK